MNEIAGDERRALLYHLEAQPDGWRRCALAFLEDQAWRSALNAPLVAAPLILPIVARPGTTTTRITATRVGRYAVAAMMGAMCAVGGFRAGVVRSTQPGPVAVAALDPVVSPANLPDLTPKAGQAIGFLNLINPADGEALPRQIPILAATESNERWLAAQPATIPDYVKAQWERSGFRVEEHRRLVDFDLNEGGLGAIPVNELDVRYVGQQPL